MPLSQIDVQATKLQPDAVVQRRDLGGSKESQLGFPVLAGRLIRRRKRAISLDVERVRLDRLDQRCN
jgi:hypothetical protein